MGTAPTAISMRRLQSELKEWQRHPPEGCRLISCEPLTVWVIEMIGPETAPALYANEIFRLQVNFNFRYPISPPDVVFIPPTPIHPHIYSNGHICLDILYDSHNGGWSPALTISKVALSLRSMLASADVKKGPQGDKEYCMRTVGKSPRDTRWEFEDDKV